MWSTVSQEWIIAHLYHELLYNNAVDEKDKESFRKAIRHILEESEQRGKRECEEQ